MLEERMRRVLFATFALSFLINCKMSVIYHNENKAAKIAIEFAKVALVQHEVESGYSLLSHNFKKMYPFEKFSQMLSRLHPSTYPLWITAEEFEPMPGQKAMNIFLYGEGGSEKFFYRFVMEGTTGAGYTVSGIYRGNGPYPASKLRQKLKRPYSTKT